MTLAARLKQEDVKRASEEYEKARAEFRKAALACEDAWARLAKLTDDEMPAAEARK